MKALRSISDLVDAPYNPRKISDAELGRLKSSLANFGDISGITWNRSTGHLVTGHQRLRSLREQYGDRLNLVVFDDHATIRTPDDELFRVRIVEWDDATEKAANIAANSPDVMGEFDNPKLTSLLQELEASGLDLAMTGLGKEMLDAFMRPAVEEDEPPTPAGMCAALSSLGDIWLLGDHRLMCGDARKPEDMKRLIIDPPKMVFTDPPYGVSIGAKNRFLNSKQKAGRNLDDIANDDTNPEALGADLCSAFTNLRHACAEDCTYFVCAPQGGSLGMMMMMMMKDAGLPIRHVLIWKKNQPTFSMGRLDYDYQHEPILLTWTKSHHYYGLGDHRTSVWSIDKPRASKEHPTMKPVALVANALLNNSLSGDVVGDIFCGSGTTIVACEQLGRRCAAMEIEPKYVDVAIRRWESLTGKVAITEGAGETLRSREAAVV